MSTRRRVLATIDQDVEGAPPSGGPQRAALRADHADVDLGRILRDAKAADVVVTVGSQPEAVVVSVDRYRTLVRREQEELAPLHRLTAHFDALVAGMQGPEAAAALARGFAATPEAMSAAALAAARRARDE